VRFILRQLIVEGSTVFTEGSLQAAYRDLLGQEISLGDVYAVANGLTAKYRNDGYVLSRVVVPPQRINDGIVRLQAVEGYIAQVRIQGTEAAPRPEIEAIANRIKASRPLQARALERALLLINDLPGVAARSTLSPSAEPNAADLTIELFEKRVSAAANVNNRGSKSLGPWRADLSGDISQLLWGYDRLGLRVIQTLFNNELNFVTGGYDRWIGPDGLRVGVNGAYVNSNPGPPVNVNLPTNSGSGTAYVSYPFVRSRVTNLTGRASFTYYDAETNINVPAGTIPFAEDNIRAIRVGATYDLVDRFRGVNVMDLEFSQGLNIFGASGYNSPLASRQGSNPNFNKITLYAARLQEIAPKWSALFAVNAQYAFSKLLTPEAYTFGGEFFGRAYDAAELVGDSGAALKIELRYTNQGVGVLRNYTLYGFYEIGEVYNRNPVDPGQQQSQSAADMGFGVRSTFSHNLSGYLELAVPLTKIVNAYGDYEVRLFGAIQFAY
jgi:hemolysin activation/secretion protein